MGYTHYWRNSAERIPAQAVMIIRDIVDQAYADHIIQYEYDAAKLPVVNKTEIRFNGIGENGHETFHFTVQDGTVAFCKTARKPYDEIVMKVLIVLKYVLKDE